MTTKAQFKGDAFAAIYRAGRGCTVPAPSTRRPCVIATSSAVRRRCRIAPAAIKRLREGAHVSQPVSARLLNTRESTAQKWAAGTKRPSGMALTLLAVVKTPRLKVLA